MTSFGFNDAGGGTLVPRLLAGELGRRGWDVTVFHAGRAGLAGPPVRAARVGGGRRPAGRRLQPPARAARPRPPAPRARRPADHRAPSPTLLDRVRPDVVHFHNLHNLGAALLDETVARGIRSFFTPTTCGWSARATTCCASDGVLCDGPGAAAPTARRARLARRRRLRDAPAASMRERVPRASTSVPGGVRGVRRTLVDAGLPGRGVDVLPPGVPGGGAIWDASAATAPGATAGGRSRSASSARPTAHKGAPAARRAPPARRRRRPLRACTARSATRTVAAARARSTRAASSSWPARSRTPSCRPLLARVDVAAMPSLWWDGAPLIGGRGLAARVPVIGAAHGRPRRGRRATASTGCSSTAASDDRAGARDRSAWPTGRACSSACGAAIAAPRTFAEYVDDARGRLRGRRPRARTRSRATPLAVRWVGDHDAHLEPGATINAEVVAPARRRRRPWTSRARRPAADDRAAAAHRADVEVRHQWPPRLRRPRPAAGSR